jgi:phage terminase Nu1 subunit (DNA packaging protein)
VNISQKALAAALGISPASVTKWKRRGMPTHDVQAAQAWRSRNVGLYIRCEQPAQPAPPAGAMAPPAACSSPPATDPAGMLDLDQERAQLARQQRIAIELKNQIARAEFAPISLLSEVLAAASQAVVDRMDALPARLRKVCPDLSDAARAEVMVAIADARNEWVSGTVELVAARLDEQDADEQASDDNAEPGTAL